MSLKRIPTESGSWGFLLPRQGQPADQTPLAIEVQTINPDVLVFANSTPENSRGGSLFALCLIFLIGVLGTPALLLMDRTLTSSDWPIMAAHTFIFCFMVVLPAVLCTVIVRNPLPPSTVIDRKRRKIWQMKKDGTWISLDWDGLVPIIHARRVISPSGSFSLYMLMLCLTDKDDCIKRCVCPMPVSNVPKHVAQTWEFIRQYMDRPADALPPATLAAASGEMSYAELFDKRFQRSALDERGRPLPGEFFNVWVMASIAYLDAIAGYWLARVAPRRPYPADLRESIEWGGANPYRTVEVDVNRKLARPRDEYMRRLRWFTYQAASVIVWGGIVLTIGLSPWFRS